MFDDSPSKDAHTIHSFVNCYAIAKNMVSLMQRFLDKFDDKKREDWKNTVEEKIAEMKSILEK